MTDIRKMTTQERQEAGMVAIMVTLILMIVISLLVLGFAQISRRNQRQALDRQLSTQAFYAAETGVNDVARILSTAAPGAVVPTKTTCGSSGQVFYSALNPVIDAANEVEYTCLLVDPTPTSLIYPTVSTTGTIFPIVAESGSIGSIRLTWNAKTGDTPSAPPPTQSCPTAAANVFSDASNWGCGYGVLRFDLVPTTGSLSMNGLQNALMTTFVVPMRSGSGTSTITYAGVPGSSRIGTVCTDAQCRLTINLSPAGAAYHMRVLSLYKDVSLTVEAFSGANAGGSVVSLRDAQTLIDSTGKAQDVLRRIQVRIPLNSGPNDLSDYAIQSGEAVCKRFSIMDGQFRPDANNVVSGVGDDAASTNNALCN